MAEKVDFQPVFDRLKHLLQAYKGPLVVTLDQPDCYYLDAPQGSKIGAFAGAHKRRQYVSFYLMPIYMKPQLLEGISDKLKKRMQGKSCFNFRKVDEELMAELTELTNRSFAHFRQENGI